jgi:hypothetical protein
MNLRRVCLVVGVSVLLMPAIGFARTARQEGAIEDFKNRVEATLKNPKAPNAIKAGDVYEEMKKLHLQSSHLQEKKIQKLDEDAAKILAKDGFTTVGGKKITSVLALIQNNTEPEAPKPTKPVAKKPSTPLKPSSEEELSPRGKLSSKDSKLVAEVVGRLNWLHGKVIVKGKRIELTDVDIDSFIEEFQQMDFDLRNMEMPDSKDDFLFQHLPNDAKRKWQILIDICDDLVKDRYPKLVGIVEKKINKLYADYIENRGLKKSANSKHFVDDYMMVANYIDKNKLENGESVSRHMEEGVRNAWKLLTDIWRDLVEPQQNIAPSAPRKDDELMRTAVNSINKLYEDYVENGKLKKLANREKFLQEYEMVYGDVGYTLQSGQLVVMNLDNKAYNRWQELKYIKSELVQLPKNIAPSTPRTVQEGEQLAKSDAEKIRAFETRVHSLYLEYIDGDKLRIGKKTADFTLAYGIILIDADGNKLSIGDSPISRMGESVKKEWSIAGALYDELIKSSELQRAPSTLPQGTQKKSERVRDAVMRIGLDIDHLISKYTDNGKSKNLTTPEMQQFVESCNKITKLLNSQVDGEPLWNMVDKEKMTMFQNIQPIYNDLAPKVTASLIKNTEISIEELYANFTSKGRPKPEMGNAFGDYSANYKQNFLSEYNPIDLALQKPLPNGGMPIEAIGKKYSDYWKQLEAARAEMQGKALSPREIQSQDIPLLTLSPAPAPELALKPVQQEVKPSVEKTGAKSKPADLNDMAKDVISKAALTVLQQQYRISEKVLDDAIANNNKNEVLALCVLAKIKTVNTLPKRLIDRFKLGSELAGTNALQDSGFKNLWKILGEKDQQDQKDFKITLITAVKALINEYKDRCEKRILQKQFPAGKDITANDITNLNEMLRQLIKTYAIMDLEAFDPMAHTLLVLYGYLNLSEALYLINAKDIIPEYVNPSLRTSLKMETLINMVSEFAAQSLNVSRDMQRKETFREVKYLDLIASNAEKRASAEKDISSRFILNIQVSLVQHTTIVQDTVNVADKVDPQRLDDVERSLDTIFGNISAATRTDADWTNYLEILERYKGIPNADAAEILAKEKKAQFGLKK